MFKIELLVKCLIFLSGPKLIIAGKKMLFAIFFGIFIL